MNNVGHEYLINVKFIWWGYNYKHLHLWLWRSILELWINGKHRQSLWWRLADIQQKNFNQLVLVWSKLSIEHWRQNFGNNITLQNKRMTPWLCWNHGQRDRGWRQQRGGHVRPGHLEQDDGDRGGCRYEDGGGNVSSDEIYISIAAVAVTIFLVVCCVGDGCLLHDLLTRNKRELSTAPAPSGPIMFLCQERTCRRGNCLELCTAQERRPSTWPTILGRLTPGLTLSTFQPDKTVSSQ